MKQYSTTEVEKLGLKVAENKLQEIRYTGVFDCAWKMLKNEGILAFYKGLTPNLIKVFPSSGMFFLAYENTLRYLNKP
jgi:hypothetical protein